jgi:hypothetical protein
MEADIQEVLSFEEAKSLIEGFSNLVQHDCFSLYSEFTQLTLEDRYQVVMSCFMKFA